MRRHFGGTVWKFRKDRFDYILVDTPPSLSLLTVAAPAGSILHAPKPAPVASRHIIGQMLPDGRTLGDTLLEPTRIYALDCLALVAGQLLQRGAHAYVNYCLGCHSETEHPGVAEHVGKDAPNGPFDACKANGKTIGENCSGRFTGDREVIRAYDQPMLNDAGKLIGELQLIYNKARQAAITKELSEIVGGAEALK